MIYDVLLKTSVLFKVIATWYGGQLLYLLFLAVVLVMQFLNNLVIDFSVLNRIFPNVSVCPVHHQGTILVNGNKAPPNQFDCNKVDFIINY